jgi:peroxiredoxin
MKKKMLGIGLLAVMGTAFVLTACPAKMQTTDGYTIEGKMQGLADGTCVAVAYMVGDDSHADSGMVSNGTFTIKGEISLPARALLQVKSGEVMMPLSPNAISMRGDEVDNQLFYLEHGITKVNGDKLISAASITGGKAQSDYRELIAFLGGPKETLDALVKKQMEYVRENNKAAIDENIPKLRSLRDQLVELEKQFVKDHPTSYVSLQMVADNMEKDLSYEPLFAGLSDELKNTPVGKKLGEQVAFSDITAPGKPVIAFTQNDTQGKPVSLDSFKGKYVLIDFWASWCKPCRAENPNLIKAYKQFHDKNFEVVGISLDDKKASWMEAIKADKLPWVHLSDLKGWKNEVAVAYNIKGIPQNFLISPEGIIVAKNIHGEELTKTLEKILAQ